MLCILCPIVASVVLKGEQPEHDNPFWVFGFVSAILFVLSSRLKYFPLPIYRRITEEWEMHLVLFPTVYGTRQSLHMHTWANSQYIPSSRMPSAESIYGLGVFSYL